MITAADVLDSKLWADVKLELEKDLVDQFQNIPPDHADGLKGVALRFWALREVCAELERRLRIRAERQTVR